MTAAVLAADDHATTPPRAALGVLALLTAVERGHQAVVEDWKMCLADDYQALGAQRIFASIVTSLGADASGLLINSAFRSTRAGGHSVRQAAICGLDRLCKEEGMSSTRTLITEPEQVPPGQQQVAALIVLIGALASVNAVARETNSSLEFIAVIEWLRRAFMAEEMRHGD